jgi:hypothetical protein
MRMIRRPRDRARRSGSRFDDLANLHPAIEHVQIGCAVDEPKTAFGLLGAPEPSEEKEQIADTDLMSRKVRCCRSSLSEYGPPSLKTPERAAPQVGIEMCAIADAYATARELSHQ